ncbi:MAG: extracellular solute-binding protein family 5 [Thermomicrobiales bacterium]|nr:extracellular solute-binding protein family 5 [Thermomicrobiales bacterium]MDF3037710.1 extracellular solute-binding protein family 5 [Thermomicrobiales bacterium]
MNDSRVNRLFAVARSGQMSRRQLLETGLKLGLASPVILSLIEAAPRSVSAAPSVPDAHLMRTGAAQESSGTFTTLLTSGTEDIDPHYTYSEIASAIALLVYDMLIILRGDSTDEFDPRLAESWEVSDDQTTFTFHLYPDVTFHDGTPANAQAVKDSYTRWIELGGSPVNVITRFVESPDQMEVVDDVTLRFNLSSPEPLFLAAMASSYGPMVISPTAIAENATEDDPYAHLWAQQFAIGSGPYLLESNSLNEGIVLSRFENYRHGWEDNHFDQVVFRVVPENATRRQLIESGEADGTANNLTVDDLVALRENPAVQVIEYASTFVNWTIMNAPRLMTPEVRQGFSYAFPYDDVQNSVYQGLLQRSGPIPDGVRGFDPDVFLYQTDLERAKDLIVGGGFVEGDTFEYMTDANLTTAQTVAQLFQANVAEMGFNLEIISVDYSTIESTIYGDAPAEERPHFIAPWGWWPDYNDPWNQLWPNFTEANIGGGGSNGGYWLNPRFEEIMAEAENYEDEERLQELMIEAQNILTELDPPAIYLGQVLRYVVLGADIQGFVPNPLYLDSYNVYDMSRASS